MVLLRIPIQGGGSVLDYSSRISQVFAKTRRRAFENRS